jgi:hypothetical protein
LRKFPEKNLAQKIIFEKIPVKNFSNAKTIAIEEHDDSSHSP